MVIVADGSDEAHRRISRVLEGDPGMGVVRHVDAGYDKAVDIAKERGVKIQALLCDDNSLNRYQINGAAHLRAGQSRTPLDVIEDAAVLIKDDKNWRIAVTGLRLNQVLPLM